MLLFYVIYFVDCEILCLGMIFVFVYGDYFCNIYVIVNDF